MERKEKLFYGWKIAVSGFIILATAFTIVSNLAGLFVTSLQEALQAGRSQVALQFTLCTLSCTIVTPFVGRILKKVPLRVLMSLGILLGGFGLISMAFAKSLLVIYIIGIIMGVAQAGCTMLPVNMMVQNWFDEKRGTVTGLVLAGSGFGGFVFTQVITRSISAFGYQTAYVIAGICVLLLCLPLTLFVVRLTPQEMGQLPYGASEKSATEQIEASGIMLQEAKKMPAFKVFFLGVFISALMYSAVSQQVPAYLTDMGYSMVFISWVNSSLMLSLTVAKPILGGFMDKKGSFFCISIGVILMLIGIGCLLFPIADGALFCFGICFGLGASLITVVPAYVSGATFGKKDYGAIYGIISVAMAIGMGVGAPVAGFIYDKTGGYMAAWVLCGLCLLIFWTSMRFVTRNRYGVNCHNTDCIKSH